MAESSHLDEEALWRQGRRVSLLEAMLWISGISTALATPYWFGFSPLLIIFYGSLGALIWRLSKALPIKLAFMIALAFAVIVTAIMVPIIQR